jgi:hypothetical protein
VHPSSRADKRKAIIINVIRIIIITKVFLVFFFFNVLSLIFLILIKLTIQTIKVIAISNRGVILIIVSISVGSAGISSIGDGTQYNIGQ